MIMLTRKSSILRQFLWAATLAIGFGTFWFLLVQYLGGSILLAWQGEPRNEPPSEQLVVRSDGTPLIRRIPYHDLSGTTYRDLSGRVQKAPDQKYELHQAVSTYSAQGTPGFFSPALSWRERLKVFTDERNATWYFVHDGRPDGAGYFVGYERGTNRRVGFIGLNGLRWDPVPAAEWIPVRGELISGEWSSLPLWLNSGQGWPHNVRQDVPGDLPPRLVYVPSGNRLRLVDLAAGTITTVFEATEPIESPGIPRLLSWSGGRLAKGHPILVRTRQRIYALDRQRHKIIKVFTIPSEADRERTADWYETENGQSTVVFWRTGYRLGNDGAIKDRFEFTLQTGGGIGLNLNQTWLDFFLPVSLPAPMMLVLADVLIGFDRLKRDPAAVQILLERFRPSVLAVLALSIALAIITWRRSGSFGLPKKDQITWTVFVLVFGFFAFMGFLLYRRWPIRLKCPNCHQPAPRDRPACALCGAGFPEPALKGIEVFA
jgi:hypothetical protein